ncbi:hypothetical protein DUNSADRAFT_16690 [Dunaliella salina]|uniref:Encoded protein n=1 Tax=Dunaliella salina TaxID=3046 RepID=A0ABQ7H0S7_DUNSA|nr:hypothetical protein DUNSADRAFT_16690 [Dunaliella salina]KAF5840457.1 hypothetical protein DUNSADRAFT_16690 [Dunaliella salina]|eukprot:KAF5840456.1 hypothetical protein DUNSADRAFT_16690 [Dunaliella salina]
MSMPQLLLLFEAFPEIFDDIIKMVRSDTGFKSLCQSCRTFHGAQAFLGKITTLKLRLWNEEANGSVAQQLATVPRGAHITKLVLCHARGSGIDASPFLSFQRGMMIHLNCWRPGMLELSRITSLELKDIKYAKRLNGVFGGTLFKALPNLQHLDVADIYRSEELLNDCAEVGLPLKSLAVSCDSGFPGSDSDLFGAMGRLTSLEALTIYADVAHHQDLPLISGLTRLMSFTWDVQEGADFEVEHGNFGDVLTCWSNLTTLSLFNCAPRVPLGPESLRFLHIHLLHSGSLIALHPLPQGMVFSIDLLLLEVSSNLEAVHRALGDLDQATTEVDFTCSHLRLMCGTHHAKGSLHAALPLLATHSHVFIRAGTHEVSAMHVRVMPGEILQLASQFTRISKMGLVDYDLTSMHVLDEAVNLPGLSVLQLRFRDEGGTRRACELQVASVAGQVRQQPVPLTIEYEVYPYPEGYPDEVPGWMLSIGSGWDSHSAAGLQSQVSLCNKVPCKFAVFSRALNDAFF